MLCEDCSITSSDLGYPVLEKARDSGEEGLMHFLVDGKELGKLFFREAASHLKGTGSLT